ncbi:MAG: hypothetical protein ACP5P3_05920 [Ignavibacteria bacterium]
MKKSLMILIPVFTIIWVISFYLLRSSFYTPELNKAQTIPVFHSIDTLKTSVPDYVPPPRGGKNQRWNCNRNYYLDPQRQCYFGRGMKYRHRYGQQE